MHHLSILIKLFYATHSTKQSMDVRTSIPVTYERLIS